MTYELPPAWDGRVNSLGFAKPPAETRVVAAMSGGVDSSVVAAMLKAQGYDVIGITLQLYDHGAAIEKKGACCAGQDIHDARNVSDQIGIPHYVLDYESKFREQVMEDFADTYLAGSTPIPCIRCNQTVKFSDLLKTARDLGADCLATGHYIRRTDGDDGPELHRAADASRDQSYFGRCANWLISSICRWLPSRTVRTSVSCRKAPMPRLWKSCVRVPDGAETLNILMVACSVSTMA